MTPYRKPRSLDTSDDGICDCADHSEHRTDCPLIAYAADSVALQVERTALHRIRKAWNDAGPFPEYHHDMQDELRRRWSTLADALDDLGPLR